MADLKSRIQFKHDTAANWAKATNFIPLAGEIIIYDTDGDTPVRFKIGDGINYVNALPFASKEEALLYTEQNLTEEQKTQARENLGLTNIEFATNKITKITANVTDEQYPSAKATRDFLLDHSAYVTPEMYGAVGDGTTDDTAAIQAAINAAVNEDKIVYLYKKTYATTAPLVFNIGLTKFICDGIIKYSGTEQAILVSGQNITIDIERIYAENGTAVEFNASEKSILFCDVCIGMISSSVKGFRMYTGSNYCISYNKFICKGIHSTEKCIEIWADAQWITENTISPGKMSGAVYGVYIYSNPSLTESNGVGDITFAHGMLEDLAVDATAIYLEKTSGNYFKDIRCQENYGSTIVSFNGNCSYNNIYLSQMILDKIDLSNLGEQSYHNILQGRKTTLIKNYPVPRGRVDSRVNDNKLTYDITNISKISYVTLDMYTNNILGSKNTPDTHYYFHYANLNGLTFTLGDIYSNNYSESKGAVVTLSFADSGGRIKLLDCNGDLIIDNTTGAYAGKIINVQWAGKHHETEKNLWLINADATETTSGFMSPEDKIKINALGNSVNDIIADKEKLDNIPEGVGYEAYLNHGGKNLSNAYSPMDAAMIPQLGANRFAFMPETAATVEYSIDDGVTWTPRTSSDGHRLLFNKCEANINYYIGNNTDTGIDKSTYKLRVTIDTILANINVKFNKFMLYIATNGSSGCYCTVSARTNENYNAGNDTWDIFADHANISGWPGYNIINVDEIYTSTSATTYREIRFELGVTSHPADSPYSGLRITNLQGFGRYISGSISAMAETGHLYSYDHYGNATFPKNVIASEFNGTATKAYKDNAGNIIHETYIKKTGGTMTGALVLAADPTAELQATTKQYVDNQITEKITEALGDIEAALAAI